MKRRLRRPDRLSSFTLAVLGLTLMLVLMSLGLTACGTDSSARTTTLDTALTTTTTTSDVSATETVMDTGYTTTSTTPASVPALSSGITPEQVLQLVASKSQVPAEEWELRDSKNLGDWAVAKLYTSRFPEQMDERGVAAVFVKKADAWFFQGWVSLSDSSAQQTIELNNMDAPDEVWEYFGLEQATPTTADWMTTSSTATLPASYPSFQRELSGAGYHEGMVHTVPDGDAKVMEVWVWVDPAKENQATYDAVYDRAVTLAQKYGIADSTGGRLRVMLFDAAPGQPIYDHIVASKDFSLAGAEALQVMGVTDGIPTPLIDGAFYYLGNGHFSRAKGEDFYWRDGHFVNADGSPLQVPESIKQKLREKGYTGDITQPGSP